MLYLDSEGDPELHFRISDHLGMCPDCAEWFAKQQRFEQAVSERLAQSEVTPEMWDRIVCRAGIDEPAASGRRWLVFGGMLAAACLVVLFLFPSVYTSRGSELASFAAAWHERWEQGSLQPDFASASDEQVERYLKGQVPFRVHCPPRKDVDFAVSGAGVRTAKDQTAAYIVGRVEKAPVSILVLARESLDAFPTDREHLAQGTGRHRCRERGYHMISGIVHDNVVVVIGAAPTDVLEKVLDAYGSYHASRG
jgi:anti-sigma factor RsiW